MTRLASFRSLVLSFAVAAAVPLAARDWIVDNSAPAGGDGSDSAPLSSLAAVQEASEPGDAIVLRPGSAPYAEGLVLKEQQSLRGADGRPVIANPGGDGLTLAAGTTVSGITVRAGTYAAIRGEAVGEISLLDVTLEINGEASALVLRDLRGAFRAGGSISGSGTGTAIVLEGGAGDVAFNQLRVTQRSGPAVAIRNRTGGSVSFGDGSPVAVSEGKGEAIELTGNAGQIAFRDAVRIKGSGPAAVRISGGDAAIQLPYLQVEGIGGTLVQGVSIDQSQGPVVISGSIHNVAQRGLSVTKSANVSLQKLTFEKAASADGEGCGAASAAGAHLECSAAIYLQDVQDVAMQEVRVDDTSQMGIIGDTVRGLSIGKSIINGSGDELDESGVLLRNATGEIAFLDTRVRGSEARQMSITNDTGDAAVTIRGCDIGGSKPPEGQQGLLLSAAGDAKVRLAIEGSTIANNFSNGVHVTANDTAQVDVTIAKSKFASSSTAILLAPADASVLTWRIEENGITGSSSVAVSVHSTSRAGVHGSIERNTIGLKGKSGSGATCGGGCGAIALTALSRGSFDATVAGNIIQQVDSGIRARAGENAEMRVRITGNDILEPALADAGPAIAIQAGMRPTDTAAVCAEVGGEGELANRVSGSWNPSAGGAAIQFVQRVPRASLAIAGYAGDKSAAANAAKFVATRNSGAAAAADVKGELTLANACPISNGEH